MISALSKVAIRVTERAPQVVSCFGKILHLLERYENSVAQSAGKNNTGITTTSENKNNTGKNAKNNSTSNENNNTSGTSSIMSFF